eukprot:TRINITY_DN7974_c0_g3_i1.p1 TRINITY_DN7974_c0_g3~~TRINITY_DN7974_c0_g3_i1.p1  ORF type:complete len:354 (+),score=43.06 TRINITY_DN7974_c0_g3_i1:60-1064(+)
MCIRDRSNRPSNPLAEHLLHDSRTMNLSTQTLETTPFPPIHSSQPVNDQNTEMCVESNRQPGGRCLRPRKPVVVPPVEFLAQFRPIKPKKKVQRLNSKKKHRRGCYKKVTNELRDKLIDLTENNNLSMRQAAKNTGIKYSTAKTIIRIFKRDGRRERKNKIRARPYKKSGVYKTIAPTSCAPKEPKVSSDEFQGISTNETKGIHTEETIKPTIVSPEPKASQSASLPASHVVPPHPAPFPTLITPPRPMILPQRIMYAPFPIVVRLPEMVKYEAFPITKEIEPVKKEDDFVVKTEDIRSNVPTVNVDLFKLLVYYSRLGTFPPAYVPYLSLIHI